MRAADPIAMRIDEGSNVMIGRLRRRMYQAAQLSKIALLEGVVREIQSSQQIMRVGLNAGISGLSAKIFLLRCNR